MRTVVTGEVEDRTPRHWHGWDSNRATYHQRSTESVLNDGMLYVVQGASTGSSGIVFALVNILGLTSVNIFAPS